MTTAVLRHSGRDAWLVLIAVAQGVLVLSVPSAPLIALGLWWNANTVAHNFIHLPFFRARWANTLFSCLLSLILGVPQTLWRDRHLAHHAGRPWAMRWSGQMVLESVLVLMLWIGVALQGAAFFVGTWLTGWLVGLTLCQLQGYFEHARGTVSHYGALYNFLFFNDGYHVEHHARPGRHWAALGRDSGRTATGSRFPAVLRWLDLPVLDALERVVLQSRALQRVVLAMHERAFRDLLATMPAPQRIVVIGGGLFPRTAIILRRLVPAAVITIVDQSAAHLDCARLFLDAHVTVVEGVFTRAHATGADLVVVPLAFVGDRAEFYDNPPAARVLVHDWVWRRRGTGQTVSLLLLKRVNLVTARAA